jgi:hypothetical protein
MSDNKIYKSEKLDLNFKIKKDKNENDVIVFEDGVNYRNHEIRKIKNCDNIELKNIHNIKKNFGGVIL